MLFHVGFQIRLETDIDHDAQADPAGSADHNLSGRADTKQGQCDCSQNRLRSIGIRRQSLGKNMSNLSVEKMDEIGVCLVRS